MKAFRYSTGGFISSSISISSSGGSSFAFSHLLFHLLRHTKGLNANRLTTIGVVIVGRQHGILKEHTIARGAVTGVIIGIQMRIAIVRIIIEFLGIKFRRGASKMGGGSSSIT
jgi:hypothetical protein